MALAQRDMLLKILVGLRNRIQQTESGGPAIKYEGKLIGSNCIT